MHFEAVRSREFSRHFEPPVLDVDHGVEGQVLLQEPLGDGAVGVDLRPLVGLKDDTDLPVGDVPVHEGQPVQPRGGVADRHLLDCVCSVVCRRLEVEVLVVSVVEQDAEFLDVVPRREGEAL